MTSEEFLESLGVDIEGHVLGNVALADLQDLRRHVLRQVPVLLVPLLENGHGAARDLDVEFDILGQAGEGEVGGTHQRRGADDFEARLGDVGFGVEFVLAIDAAEDLARADAFDDGRDAGEEIVLEFLFLQAVVEAGRDLLHPLGEGLAGALADLVAHEDADSVHLLPLVLEG